ncbi:EAL domain-containing protein [Aquincola tertiaricarbonis]|uniref:EAL domain-containing protein n=1 Tax=Aquincola tertiaricarbonis TaxID=391953 RepID=A0ABY4S6X5_AQUTE|nr:EAL domain-containing protein [Aquincola tertiaricarbonis]URI08184.1 EAL domain-containing protein [Aquincola tertiaricarbonis]
MSRLFARFLGRLSVGRKLLLIYLLDLTAVIYISGILINEKFIAIDFARKEESGIAYIRRTSDVLVTLARTSIGPVPAARPEGWLPLARSVAETERLHGEGMKSAEAASLLQRSLEALGPRPAPDTVTAVLGQGRALVTRVGNQSNLILDPDLDSYYSMSLVLLRYPELLDVLDRIGAQLRPDTRRESAVLRTQYLVLEGQLDAVAQGIASDQAEAVAASTPALRAALDPAQARLAAAIEGLRRASRAYIDDGATRDRLRAVHLAQAELVSELHQAWQLGATELERLLATRIDGLYTRMWMHLGTALVLLLAILSLVWGVARQISVPLRRMAGVADEVRRTGDPTLRADWRSQDEIGRLVLAFNDMLAQLDRERTAQQELAASARAAEAQRALVESTPIPLMVTAIPGHEVLHANPPAESWLNGRRDDPWAVGLEAPVRAHFFQQLADRDAVHEFEVRWQGSGEPAWAVLSARRVQYQGRDAVITVFSPINHLKQMRRRLELWAKVFEASTEAIMIVGADRRILTTNLSFHKATGYDLQDVVGEPPRLLLGNANPPGFIDEVWAAVGRRGTWQGELWLRRRDGTEYPAWMLISPVREGPGARGDVTHYIFTSIDIADRKKSEARIQFLAQHDVLTELPNRSLCIERLRLALQQAQRTGQKVAVMFIDLDRFKDINDTLGHHIGDGLLRSVARRLLEAVRAGDTVSRLGGDEFVVVINGVDTVDDVTHVVEQRLIPRIRQPHVVDGTELNVSCSVGIALAPDDSSDLDTLMRHADTAMYQAKAGGRNASAFFTAEMTERALQRHRTEAALRRAIEAGELRLAYQPRIDARSGRTVGVEGLLRWDSEELGPMSPSVFVPIAEESGLVVPMGAWVIEEACAQIGRWRDQGLPPLNVSINLSAPQLQDPTLLDTLAGSLARHAVPPGGLELELTESMLMDRADSTLRTMQAIRQLGVGLAIDDFGTGYSSLNYLNRFPINKLKIDRSFVHDMLADSTARAIVQAIVGLGHTLKLKVVAEGVETPAQAAALRAAGCDELQGFFYSQPLRPEALGDWLTEPALNGD